MNEDCFIDSGAWSLFRLHVLKAGNNATRQERHKKNKVKSKEHSKLLDVRPVTVGQKESDFSFYDLNKGSDFRKYLDKYASFIRHYQKQGIRWFATVDVIGSPEMTREVQRYFEEEHGLAPVPVVHFGSPLSYLDYYLEKGYKMVGLGGFARRPDRKEVIKWCDEAFLRICPASNQRLPITRVHGFAMTTWEYIHRWPWFSVDSTSYLLYGTYGLLCVPRSPVGKREGFSYDREPMIVSVSSRGRPVDYKTRMHISQVHGDSANARRQTMAWLEFIGLKLGKVDLKTKEVIEPGVASSNEIRTSANLRYFQELEHSIPAWPWPLDNRIVKMHVAEYHRGFGFGF